MCVEIKLNGKHAETMGELRTLLAFEPPILPGYGAAQDDLCLCPVDTEALAAKLGGVVTPDEWGVAITSA